MISIMGRMFDKIIFLAEKKTTFNSDKLPNQN